VTTRTRAKKELGQHWLVNGKILGRIARALPIEPGDTLVEIGPGRGALTRLLAERAERLIAVEVDRDLAGALREQYAASDHVCVVQGDVLDLPVAQILNEGGGRLPYVVVGNLPYFIGSAIVRKFLSDPVPPRTIIATLQLEVAERMAAQPGDMSYLAVETQSLAEVRLLFRVPASAFRPPPKVQSAVVRLDVRDNAEVEVDDRERFLDLVKAGFAAPRKRLRNSLAVGLRTSAEQAESVLITAGIDPTLRPEALELDAWRDLYLAYRRAVPPS
jgi:16S rRNA (adenine1518-N6/adenine1519-N6)-dimethyltransferase